MEQEQILSKLNEGLGQTSLSERTIADFVGVLEVPEDESQHADFFSKQVKILKTLEGQLSHEVASKVEEFKKNYKPAPAKKETEQKNDDEMPQWAKEIKEQLDAQKTKETEMASKAQREQILKSAYDKAKEGGADNDAVLEIVKASIDISESDTETSVKDKMVSKYNEMYKKLYGNGAHPSVTQMPSSANRKAEDEKFKELLRRNGKLPKKN